MTLSALSFFIIIQSFPLGIGDSLREKNLNSLVCSSEGKVDFKLFSAIKLATARSKSLTKVKLLRSMSLNHFKMLLLPVLESYFVNVLAFGIQRVDCEVSSAFYVYYYAVNMLFKNVHSYFE